MPHTYNGWANKPTWLVNIWLGDYLQESLAETEIRDTYDASNYLRDVVEEIARGDSDSLEAGLVSDLLTYVMAEIDYRELAIAYVRELEESGL